MKHKLLIYETSSGHKPFSDWLDNLRDRQTRARIRARLNRIELGSLSECVSVGDGVFELRIRGGSGCRVYFGQDEDTLVLLLCDVDKKSHLKDIELANSYWRDYRNAD